MGLLRIITSITFNKLLKKKISLQKKIRLLRPIPNSVIAKDFQSCRYCCYVRCATFIVRVGGNTLTQNRRNSLPHSARTFRQRSYNQKVGCLLCSMDRIFDILDGSLDKRKVRCLVLCCGQDGYRTQIPQHSIDSYR